MSESCDETYDVYDERVVRARKPHRCGACRETILPGHRYCRIGVVFDGEARTYKRCVRCQFLHEHLREKCRASVDRSSWPVTEHLWPDEQLACGQDYVEEWGPLPDEIAALAFLSAEEQQTLKLDAFERVPKENP